MFIERLELRVTLVYSDKKHFIGFLRTLKCMTLSDHEIPFYAKMCFLRAFDQTRLCRF